MVSLKYSVGTANKFVGLHVDNDSSDDEEHTAIENNQPSSTPMPSAAENTFAAPTKSTSHNFEADNTRTQSRNFNRNNQNPLQAQKPKGRNGFFNNTIHNDGDKWSDSHSGKINNSQEKFHRPRKQDRNTQGKPRPKKEFNNQSGNEISSQKYEKKAGKPFFKDQSQEVFKGEDNTPSATASAEKVPDTEETQKAVETPTKPAMMDLEAWKQQQAARRINIPSSHGDNSTSEFKDELESKGYKLYVKHQESKENDTQMEDTNGDSQKKKSNTVNLFEYMYNENGFVELFNDQRTRRRKNSSNRMDRKPKNLDYRTNDAPDFKDDRAFPALGNPKVLS